MSKRSDGNWKIALATIFFGMMAWWCVREHEGASAHEDAARIAYENVANSVFPIGQVPSVEDAADLSYRGANLTEIQRLARASLTARDNGNSAMLGWIMAALTAAGLAWLLWQTVLAMIRSMAVAAREGSRGSDD